MGHYGDLMIEQELSDKGIETEYKVVHCGYCGKQYNQRTVSQVAGFREMDYDTCPYCGKENGKSMQVDYYNSKLEN